jgi:hypothetical protein
VDGGLWILDDGRWPDDGHWPAAGRWPMKTGAMDAGNWTQELHDGRWTTDAGFWTMDAGLTLDHAWPVKSGRRTLDADCCNLGAAWTWALGTGRWTRLNYCSPSYFLSLKRA